MTPQEKKLRIIRQIAIFGTVLAVFLIYNAYKLKTGHFG